MSRLLREPPPAGAPLPAAVPPTGGPVAAVPPVQEIHSTTEAPPVAATLPDNAPAWWPEVVPALRTLFQAGLDAMPVANVAAMALDKLTDSGYEQLELDVLAPDWQSRTLALLPPGFRSKIPQWSQQLLAAIEQQVREDAQDHAVGLGDDVT